MSDTLLIHEAKDWILFNGLILLLLVLDLGVFNRKAHVVKMKEALLWSLVWILIALGFGGWIFHTLGHKAGVEYLTGYVVEKSLSVDNLFVFLVIFRTMGIEKRHQHRLLFWGVLGAIFLRGLMIAAGAQLLEHFHWLIYVFGAFLIYTGFKFFGNSELEIDPSKSPVQKILRKFLPVAEGAHPGRFLVSENGARKITISFLTLALIETSDVVFAVDSVPAVFGVTRDPFLVYSSNIFAILGLRSLFFVLEDFMDRFHLLKYALAIILIAVGAKMCLEKFIHVSSWASLLFILSVLVGAAILSVLRPPRTKRE